MKIGIREITIALIILSMVMGWRWLDVNGYLEVPSVPSVDFQP